MSKVFCAVWLSFAVVGLLAQEVTTDVAVFLQALNLIEQEVDDETLFGSLFDEPKTIIARDHTVFLNAMQEFLQDKIKPEDAATEEIEQLMELFIAAAVLNDKFFTPDGVKKICDNNNKLAVYVKNVKPNQVLLKRYRQAAEKIKEKSGC